MATSIELSFGDGDYLFALPLPLLDELQKKTGIGIGALFAKLIKGRYAFEEGATFGDPAQAEYALADVLEPIRLGLIGGNQGLVNGQQVTVNPMRATELMKAYCYPARPLAEAWTFAVAIVSACVEGYEDPDKKKAEAPPEAAVTREDGSTIPEPSAISPSAASQSSTRKPSASKITTPS